jgi:hypothetical protein
MANRDRQALQEKLGRASACAVADQQHFLHPTGPPRPGRHPFAEALLEDGLLTFRVATPPSTQSQSQRHPLALNRKILQLSPVTSVASGRRRSATIYSRGCRRVCERGPGALARPAKPTSFPSNLESTLRVEGRAFLQPRAEVTFCTIWPVEIRGKGFEHEPKCESEYILLREAADSIVQFGL